MFETVLIVWGIGFAGYIIFKSKTNSKDKHRCNVKNEIIKLKKFNNHISENSKGSFK